MLGRQSVVRRVAAVVLVGVCVAAPAVAVPRSSPATAWTRQFAPLTGDADVNQTDALSGAAYAAGMATGPFDGQAFAGGGGDAYVRKYTRTGAVDWTRQVGTSEFDMALALAASSSRVHIGGFTDGALPAQTNSGISDAFIQMYSAAGVKGWVEQFGTAGSDAVYVIATNAIGVFVAGSVGGALPEENSFGGTDLFVRRYDHSGNLVWTDQFGSSTGDAAVGLALTTDAVYAVGHATSALLGQTHAGSLDAFIRKLRISDGEPQWTRQFGTSADDAATGVGVIGSGIFVAGSTGGALGGQTHAGGQDGFVRKYTPTGGVAWTRQFGSATNEYVQDLDVTSASIFVTGYADGALPGQTSAGENDAFVRRIDPGGGTVWTRQFGTAVDDAAQGVSASADGVYVGGSTIGSLPGATGSGRAFLRRLVSYRADGAVSLAAASAYLGNDVYNATGAGQTKSAGVSRGSKRSYYIRVQNDGDALDTFTIDGCASSAKFNVAYFSGSTSITTQVVEGTYRVVDVAPGAFRTLRAVISVASDAPLDAVRTCAIEVDSARSSTVDLVQAKVDVQP